MMRTRFPAALIAATVLSLLFIGPVAAGHSHVRELGNGSCVILAPDAGEESVRLPFASGAADRRHPLHVLVHLGPAGSGVVWVQGSADDLANCDSYVNSSADRVQ